MLKLLEDKKARLVANAVKVPREPGFAELLERADSLRLRDRSSDAISLYRRAMDLQSSSPRPWLGLGWAYLDEGRSISAREAFQQAIALDGGFAEAHFGLAEALKNDGRGQEAIAEYRRYLSLSPAGADAPVAKNAIQSLSD